MEAILMNTENCKANEPDKFIISASQKLDLKSSYECAALQNFFQIYYTCKNII